MTNLADRKQFAPLLVVLAGMCWGIIGLFSKQLSADGFSPLQIAFIRVGIATVLVWLYLFIFNRGKLKIKFRDIWMFIGTGVLSLVFFSVMYFSAIQMTTLSIAAVLLYTAPCFVLIMSAIIFHEKITTKKTIAMLMAFLGCICTTGLFKAFFAGSGIGGVSLIGILLGIGSGFGYALYSIFGTAALKKYDSVTVTAYTFLFAAVTMLPFCVNREFFGLIQHGPALMNAVFIAIFSTIVPYLLYTQGLKDTEPGKASVLAFSEPLTATLTGLIVFKEALTLGGIIGILLIFFSIVFLNTKEKTF